MIFPQIFDLIDSVYFQFSFLEKIAFNYINFIEFFPERFICTQYIDNYSNEVIDQIEPRNGGQDRLYTRSTINFNSTILWVYVYPEDNILYPYIVFQKDPYFKVKFYSFYTSIYEDYFGLKGTIKHHDFCSKYVITNNLYIYYLSSNVASQFPGLKICYYEPAGNGEAVTLPMFSYTVEVYLHIGNKVLNLTAFQSLELQLQFETFQYYKPRRFGTLIDQLNFDIMNPEINGSGLIVEKVVDVNSKGIGIL